MYGLIGKMRAVGGKRDDLVKLLTGSTGSMPGCLSYVVALDLEDDDALWITEVWEDEASHKASLDLPAVREAIARARPIIAGFDQHIATRPVSLV
jgi:quinol monooxygenase YgiN